MASISYPSPAYNAGSVTDLEFERLASPQSPDGLTGLPTDSPMVYADGTGTRRVNVRSFRRALVRGFQYDSGSTEIPLSLASNTSGATRIDLIVLRLDRSTWRVTEAVVQGTPGAGTPSPTLNTGAIGVWELPLAAVTVVNGATSLSAGTVTPLAWFVGEDGQILCTSATRPPHATGRMIHETDTGLTFKSTGSAWVRPVPGFVAEGVKESVTTGQDIEVVHQSLTVASLAGVRYRLVWDGAYQSTGGSDLLRIRLRWQPGASLSPAGTLFRSRGVHVAAANKNHPVSITGTFLAPGGQITCGVTVERLNAGGGTVQLNGSPGLEQSYLLLDAY